jgi:hypothetical protein
MSTPAILEGALLAQAAGFAVHYQRGKRAFEPCWSTSPPKIAEELRRDYRDGYNIGFRTGDWSKLDGWLVVVLDGDIRGDDPAHREAAREAWRELVGDMKPTVETGGGGAHLYLRCPSRLPSIDEQFLPTLRALSHAGLEADQFCLAPGRGAGGRTPTRSTARRWFVRRWTTSEASRACARWSRRRHPRRRTARLCR